MLRGQCDAVGDLRDTRDVTIWTQATTCVKMVRIHNASVYMVVIDQLY